MLHTVRLINARSRGVRNNQLAAVTPSQGDLLRIRDEWSSFTRSTTITVGPASDPRCMCAASELSPEVDRRAMARLSTRPTPSKGLNANYANIRQSISTTTSSQTALNGSCPPSAGKHVTAHEPAVVLGRKIGRDAAEPRRARRLHHARPHAASPLGVTVRRG
jgi:hypothetical protein